MKLIVADCSAVYTGRGDTYLPRGVRAIMLKRDGSISIHNDESNKAVNYMKSASFSEELNAVGEVVWMFDSNKENLEVTIHEFIMQTEAELIENDPKTQKDGTEMHLQEWLSKHPEVLGKDFTIVAREYDTSEGPVDLLALDSEGRPVAVEIKRTAMRDAVDQCKRYVDGLKAKEGDVALDVDFYETQGLIAAVNIRPTALVYAGKKGINTVLIPSNWRDIE